jgi:hypothetical protein
MNYTKEGKGNRENKKARERVSKRVKIRVKR